ncbi:MAG: cobalamin-dependent protein [Anaerolineales bacterium]
MKENQGKDRRVVVAAALGECVHVAGVNKFLRLAESAGWQTIFLGPAVPIERVLSQAREHNADMVAVSYRLTPETGERLLADFAEQADDLYSAGVRFAFGGTPPVAARARSLGFFEQVFEGGESADSIFRYLKSEKPAVSDNLDYPQSAVERIEWKHPLPIIRHHFGLPTVEATRQGITKIAESQTLDVISLGIDQDAQANFFKPEKQNPRRTGAGGVPVRKPEHYRELFNASRCGNFPLLRTYSGTDDFIRLAEMYVETINIAWCAVPLFWFNRMDGRGPWDLKGSIREHQKLMTWYGERDIPVELNEPHHWGMRDAPDVISVVSAYLSAYNAKRFGVKHYFAQLMFNSPGELSDGMDLAKMLAVLDLIEPLESPGFEIFRQTRTGLLSYPLDPDAARAHLATTVYVQIALRPHIIHIVGHTEAHHAATANDVIEACKIGERAIENALAGQIDLTRDETVQERKQELISEAEVTIQAIKELSDPQVEDPLTDPGTLTKAVTAGILDAPQLRNNPYARGEIVSLIDRRGACVAVDNRSGNKLSEADRIARLF